MANIRRIALIGATGSLGRQTLEVIAAFPSRFQVLALTAGKNSALLSEQMARFKPRLVAIAEGNLPPGDYELATPEAIATHPEVDLVVVATSGKAGLLPTLSALRAGKRVALANKEALVMAGEMVMAEAAAHGGEILPLDSEHSALWQCLRGEDRATLARLLLTASGGPFYRLSAADLSRVSPDQAMRHPTWRMGRKITIDSATLMNKGMEVIEAHWLFSLPYEKIAVFIHPQSIVHSMVEFRDGSVKAQLSPPDMRLPIQYALSYPERWENPSLPRLGLEQLSCLTFAAPDVERFPCLRLALEAGKAGGTCPAALAAADEAAVELFLEGRIGFTRIPGVIEAVLFQHQNILHPTLSQVLQADTWAREEARRAAGL